MRFDESEKISKKTVFVWKFFLKSIKISAIEKNNSKAFTLYYESGCDRDRVKRIIRLGDLIC